MTGLFFDDSLNVTRSVQYYDAVPTNMRLNHLYNKIYCLLLNSLFATVFPLASLFYLNVCIILGKSHCYFKILNHRKLIGVQSNHGVEYFGGPAAPTLRFPHYQRFLHNQRFPHNQHSILITATSLSRW